MITLLLALMSFFPGDADLHPIHLSVTEIKRSEVDAPLRVSVTLFMDDFSRAVEYDKYAADIRAGKMSVDDLVLQYLRDHMHLRINGEELQYRIASRETNFPAVTCYLEPERQVDQVNNIEVESTIFLELFDDQRNVVHIRLAGQKEGSILLDKKKQKGEAQL